MSTSHLFFSLLSWSSSSITPSSAFPSSRRATSKLVCFLLVLLRLSLLSKNYVKADGTGHSCLSEYCNTKDGNTYRDFPMVSPGHGFWNGSSLLSRPQKPSTRCTYNIMKLSQSCLILMFLLSSFSSVNQFAPWLELHHVVLLGAPGSSKVFAIDYSPLNQQASLIKLFKGIR